MVYLRLRASEDDHETIYRLLVRVLHGEPSAKPTSPASGGRRSPEFPTTETRELPTLRAEPEPPPSPSGVTRPSPAQTPPAQ